jgi:hypothetical protein
MAVEVVDVCEGLWLWRQPHPDWDAESDWEPEVSSYAVTSGGVHWLIDALAPHPSERAAWERIDAHGADALMVLKPDHVRDVDLFARWYGADAYGPSLFWPHDAPRTKLEQVRPGMELPGGPVALHDGRGMHETPLFLPEQRAVLFADALTAPGGELRVWRTPWHEERTRPALRALLELDFEHVLVSHGAPLHDRAAFEAALEREPHGELE